MARHEADREDLIREATALRERIELGVPGEAELVIAGFRDDGRLSIYFGADPAYHFDARGLLRRAFVAGDLYRTQGTTLARLRRERTDDTTSLVRHDLAASELDSFLAAMRARLERLRDALLQGRFSVSRQVPSDEEIVARVVQGLIVPIVGKLAPPLATRRR